MQDCSIMLAGLAKTHIESYNGSRRSDSSETVLQRNHRINYKFTLFGRDSFADRDICRISTTFQMKINAIIELLVIQLL